jgi:signal transduction histidine kinase
MLDQDNIVLRRTTAFRLSIRYTIGFCLLSIIVLLLVYHHVLKGTNAQIDAGLRAESLTLSLAQDSLDANELVRIIRERSTPKSIKATNKGDPGPRFYLLVDTHGNRLAGALPQWQKFLRQQGDDTLTTLKVRTPQPILHLVEGQPVIWLRSYQTQLQNGNRLLVAQSLNEMAQMHKELLRLVGIVILLMLGVGILGGWWIGKQVIQSMEKVIQTADGIMTGDLSQRIADEPLSDEFALLAQKLNLMLARIETLMKDLREVTENVAHDMRTPLTRLHTHAEMALSQPDDAICRQALQTAVLQSEMLVHMLDAIMNIAQVESEEVISWQTQNLSDICQSALDLYEPLIEDKHLDFSCQLPTEPLWITCNPQLLAQAVGNLLDNAIKYTPTGGCLSLTLERRAQEAILTLTDSGTGIPANERERVMQRFVRLDNSRSLPGNGLGLSLVAAIVSRHSGTLSLDDNTSGNGQSGLKVTMHLPAS